MLWVFCFLWVIVFLSKVIQLFHDYSLKRLQKQIISQILLDVACLLFKILGVSGDLLENISLSSAENTECWIMATARALPSPQTSKAYWRVTWPPHHKLTFNLKEDGTHREKHSPRSRTCIEAVVWKEWCEFIKVHMCVYIKVWSHGAVSLMIRC